MLALNRTMHRLAERGRSLDDFTYNDAVSAGEIYSAMNATQFLGVSVLLKIILFFLTRFLMFLLWS